MATTLGQAYVQIIPSAEGLSGRITSLMSGEAESAGTQSGQTFGSKLVSSAKSILAAAGIAEVLKTAITEGAALEQSIGGIETLFKDSSDRMIAYANEAYSTAGVSANEYMEQATSFAASLLQSLDGDTSRAADAANQAIIDMSDNANKMGTSIESIQNAYQGFAKQNYTMLDNLKLGYGGTKTEMERLLADAEELSGVHYDISNLSDVYSAIHVIQNELDITGTTAAEASSTLSGSFASMKSAAQNFLGALTLGQDVTPALQGLVSTASTFLFDNLLPAVGNIILALPSTIATFLQEAVPQILEQGITLITTIAEGADEGIPQFYDTVINIINTLLDTIIEHLPELIEAGVKLIVNLAVGLINAIPKIIEAIPQIISKIIDGFLSVDWLSVGKQIIQGIANGIKNSASAIVEAAKNAAKTALESAKKFLGIKSPSRVFQDQIGKMIDLGLAEGITKNAGVVKDSISGLADIASTTIDPNMAVSEVSNYSGSAVAIDNENLITALVAVGNQISKAVKDKNFNATISASEVRKAVTASGMRLGI